MKPPPAFDTYCPRCGAYLARLEGTQIATGDFELSVDPVPSQVHQALSPECAGETEVRLQQVISPLTPADA